MKHSFYLKHRESQDSKLILFTCYFKQTKTKFVYSTGEKINPKHWNVKNKFPELLGRNKDPNVSSIKTQLNRYSEKFEQIVALHSKLGEELTPKILKESFNVEFKKVEKNKRIFFTAYEHFMEEKQKRKEWKPATVKRYKNIKTHLSEFEKKRKYKLTFNSINEKFFTEFTDYCYTILDHSTNTFARNVGLFKTFMFWASDSKRNYTYNKSFLDFKKPQRVITKEVALTLDQVIEIFNFDTKNESYERVRDVFVFQCLTGLRYGELKLINERTISDNMIIIKEEKDNVKDERNIPLFEISNYILKKYSNKLPLLSNQKHNEIIKKVFKAAEFTFDVEYTRTKNKEQETIIKPFFERIASHTSRRTFITIMKNKGIADKIIMKMTGHKDIKTFNAYYQVDDIAKVDAINLAFGTMELPKLKKA